MSYFANRRLSAQDDARGFGVFAWTREPKALGPREADHPPPAMALISPVVRAFPPMPQLPLLTSSTTTQVTSRIFSPSMETIASVSLRISSCFGGSEDTRSLS